MPPIRKDIIDLFRVPPGKKVRLKDYHTGWDQTDDLKALGKIAVREEAGEGYLLALGRGAGQNSSRGSLETRRGRCASDLSGSA